MVEIPSQREPIDPNMPSRRANLLAYIDQEVQNKPGEVAVVTLDLEDLKDYNDSAGHHIGDEKLKHTLNLLLANVRTRGDVTSAHSIPVQRHPDTILRYGRAWHASGDEYWVLLYEVHEQEDVDAFAARMQYLLGNEGINASVGGLLHQPGQTAAELMEKVDLLERKDKQERALQYAAGRERRMAAMVLEIEGMGMTLRKFAKVGEAMKAAGLVALYGAMQDDQTMPTERVGSDEPTLENPTFLDAT